MNKFIITEEEKDRILNMHKSRTSNQYLMEEAPTHYVYKMENGEKTDQMVGTHKYGVGFIPNEIGKQLGFKADPTRIPDGTIMDNTTMGSGEEDEGVM